MQLVFDSRFDGVREAHIMRNMLDVVIGMLPIAAVAGNTLATSATEKAAVAAIPLAPPAPSTVAADVSATAPAASTAGVAPPPPAAPPTAPPPPAATAPVATSSPAASAPTPLKFDISGLPWDVRIHAANQATVADGTWRKKKGLNDAAFIATVTAELRAKHPVTQAAATAAAPAAIVTTAPPPPPVTQTAPPPPATTAAAAPPPPAAPPAQSLMEWIGDMMPKGRVTFVEITEECKKLGANALSDFAGVGSHAAMAPVLLGALQARLAAK